MTVTNTTAEVASTYQRQVMALYYGYGRADAGATGVDAVAFAEYYLGLWSRFSSGKDSHMPSVQDAWHRFSQGIES
jgi:hypothetical protein